MGAVGQRAARRVSIAEASVSALKRHDLVQRQPAQSLPKYQAFMASMAQ